MWPVGPHWQAPIDKRGSTDLLWGPGGAWRGPSSGAGLLWLYQPFLSPDHLCPQCHYVPSEQSRSEALPHRAWLPPPQPTGVLFLLPGACWDQRPNTLRALCCQLWFTGHWQDTGRAAIPHGALEGHKDVCQLLLELLGHSAGARPYRCPLS